MCNNGCDCEWLADEQQFVDAQLQAEAEEAAIYEAQRSDGVEAMTPTEIVTILNANRHDGEIDWSHFQQGKNECYFSRNQAAFNDFVYALSPLSAEIVAKHYHVMKIIQESDEKAAL